MLARKLSAAISTNNPFADEQTWWSDPLANNFITNTNPTIEYLQGLRGETPNKLQHPKRHTRRCGLISYRAFTGGMRIRAACYGLPTLKIRISRYANQMSDKTTSVKLGMNLDTWVEDCSERMGISVSELIRLILEEKRTHEPMPEAIKVVTAAGEDYIATGSKLTWESAKFGKRVRELTSKLVSSPEENLRKEGRELLAEARFLANEFQRAGKVWGTLTPELHRKITWAYTLLNNIAKGTTEKVYKEDFKNLADILGYLFLGKVVPDGREATVLAPL
jgi:hypothetical protein